MAKPSIEDLAIAMRRAQQAVEAFERSLMEAKSLLADAKFALAEATDKEIDRRADDHIDKVLRAKRDEVVSVSAAHSAVFCGHANEVPMSCPCGAGCYCRSHTCKGR